jgi:GTPase SAR1 family protein
MSDGELARLKVLARIDELVERLDSWAEHSVPWQPARDAQALIRRLLDRIDSLRLRLEAPLVVAVFGGSGTGKSTLINALVGEDVTPGGRERPTTRRPQVITTPDLDLEPLGLPSDSIDVVRVDSTVLHDVVLVDCPDPDTGEEEHDSGQLDRLHEILPLCDVLLYTSTQQKYRSARVAEVLDVAATGCRVFFVQTHADVTTDIRDDWAKQLAEDFENPELFLVDSLAALQQQRQGRRPGGDFARLEHLLTSRLAASARLQIRRANLIDLLDHALRESRNDYDSAWPDIVTLKEALQQQHERLVGSLATRLSEELEASHYLWERRLVERVTSDWGFSPFSSLLRLSQGLGGLLASASLLRARSSAQVALLGAWQGGRWLTSRAKRQDADQRFDQLAVLGIDDSVLRESQLVVEGFAESAGFDQALTSPRSLESLRDDAAQLQRSFLDDAGAQIEEVIEAQARRSRGWGVRLVYETALTVLLGFLLFRIGRNFFYDTLLNEGDFLPLEFYLPATALSVLWAALLVMLFTRRLRRGLRKAIGGLADRVARHRVAGGPFLELEDACQEVSRSRDQLAVLCERVGGLKTSQVSQAAVPAENGD